MEEGEIFIFPHLVLFSYLKFGYLFFHSQLFHHQSEYTAHCLCLYLDMGFLPQAVLALFNSFPVNVALTEC